MTLLRHIISNFKNNTPKPKHRHNTNLNLNLNPRFILHSINLRCSPLSRQPSPQSLCPTTTPSPIPSPSRQYRRSLLLAVIRRCSQALAFICIRRIGLVLLLFHGTRLDRLVSLGLSRMVCRASRFCYFIFILLFSIDLYCVSG